MQEVSEFPTADKNGVPLQGGEQCLWHLAQPEEVGSGPRMMRADKMILHACLLAPGRRATLRAVLWYVLW